MLIKTNSCLIILFVCLNVKLCSQDTFPHFRFRDDVLITIDRPSSFNKKRHTQIIFFALPNGNTTAQTMGKIMKEGDDWHFDIQHIKAQTEFIRDRSKDNIIVVYLENNLKAWPQWKRNHPDYVPRIQALTDTILSIINIKDYELHLNGHSGGGSFIFGYLEGVSAIPAIIKRITFIDSNYGYDSSYTDKFKAWIKNGSQNRLTVFAYNDSVALYNGKPVVSATGGTWYRSKLMMQHLTDFRFYCREDTVTHCRSANSRINIYLKDNPHRQIFHTQQVELNGFIHSVFIGTKQDEKEYKYFGQRAYIDYIR